MGTKISIKQIKEEGKIAILGEEMTEAEKEQKIQNAKDGIHGQLQDRITNIERLLGLRDD